MNTYIKSHWGTMVGFISVAFVPLVFMDKVNRFVLLPQLAVALLGILVGYVGIFLTGKGHRLPACAKLGLGFLAFEVVAVAFSHSPTLAILPILTDFSYVSLLIVLSLFLTRADIDRTITAVAIVSGLFSLVGLLQYFDIGRDWIPTSGLPSATLGHRNIAAAYLAGVLPIVVYKFWTEQERFWIVAWGISFSLVMGFAIATRSMAGWISILISALFAAILWYHGKGAAPFPQLTRYHRWTLALPAAVVLVISLSPASIEKRVGEAMWHEKTSVGGTVASILADGGDKGRLSLWETTLQMIGNQPIIGIGPGNWRVQYPALAEGRMIDANTVPHRAHNDFLSVWSESGLGALLMYLALTLGALLTAWKLARGPDGPLALALAASITGCLCSELFGFPLEFYGASAPLWFGIGVLASLSGERDENRVSVSRWLPALGVVVSVVGIVVTVQYIRFDADQVRARLAAVRADWNGVLAHTEAFAGSYLRDDSVLLLRGRAYEASGRPAEAERAFRQALGVHPHATELWMGLGVSLRSQGRVAEARESFELAVKYDPQDGRALSNLGTLIASGGDMKQAIVYLEQAIDAENTPVEVYGNLSSAYRRGGQIGRAIEIARRGIEIDASSDLANALGNALAARGDHLEAIRTYEDALSSEPAHTQLLFNLARSYESLNQSGNAIRTYQKVLQGLGEHFPERRSYIERRIASLERGHGSRQ